MSAMINLTTVVSCSDFENHIKGSKIVIAWLFIPYISVVTYLSVYIPLFWFNNVECINAMPYLNIQFVYNCLQ